MVRYVSFKACYVGLNEGGYDVVSWMKLRAYLKAFMFSRNLF